MGYRSDVVLAISKKLMPHFLGVLAKEPEARALVFKDTDTLEKDYDGNGTYLAFWSDIKWYDSYPPVAAIQRFVDDCEECALDGLENADQHMRFVRMGEAPEDVVEQGYLHGCEIAVERKLSF